MLKCKIQANSRSYFILFFYQKQNSRLNLQIQYIFKQKQEKETSNEISGAKMSKNSRNPMVLLHS
jgi:hypothetical protein